MGRLAGGKLTPATQSNDVVIGDSKITLAAAGNATFAGDVRIKSYVDAGATAYNNTAIFGSNNDNSNATLVVQNYSTNGDIFVGRSPSSDKVVEISNSGSAEFGSNLVVNSYISGYRQTQDDAASLITLHSDNGNPGVKSAKFTVTSDGSGEFAGALTVAGYDPISNGSRGLYYEVLDGLIVQGRGNSTDKLFTGLGGDSSDVKIQMLADGSASFAGTVNCIEDGIVPLRIGSFSATDNLEVGLRIMGVFGGGGGIADLYQDRNGLRIGVGTTTNNTRVDGNILIDRDHNLKIGGTLPASPNITLNADGSAEFRGDVSVNNDQVKLDYRGEISVKRGPTNTVWRGMNAGDSDTVTSEILGNGTATFTGNATAKNVLARCEDDAEYALAVRNAADSAWTAHVQGDGSAQFVGGWGNDNGILLDANGFNVRADSGRGLGIYSGGNSDVQPYDYSQRQRQCEFCWSQLTVALLSQLEMAVA